MECKGPGYFDCLSCKEETPLLDDGACVRRCGQLKYAPLGSSVCQGFFRNFPLLLKVYQLKKKKKKECECNGFSTSCNEITGQCSRCTENTDGNNCEKCLAGFSRVDQNSSLGCTGSFLYVCLAFYLFPLFLFLFLVADPHLLPSLPFNFWNWIECECNGFSSSCNEITGICDACNENTQGDHCQDCIDNHFFGPFSSGCIRFLPFLSLPIVSFLDFLFESKQASKQEPIIVIDTNSLWLQWKPKWMWSVHRKML